MPRVPASVWCVVLAVCGMWIALGSRIAPSARQHDFLNLYSGGALALEGHFASLHDPEVQLAEERRIFPDLPELVPFVRPIFYAVILAPLALLPYNTAFGLWLILQSALLLACWVWAWRRFEANALVFAALFLPAPLGIASGQDCVVMLALFVVAFELMERDRPLRSGAVLALMLIKFHLVLLWPLALLVQRRWRMLAGFCAMAAVEIAICLALGGFGGARTYAALLTNKTLDHLSPSPQLMISYSGLCANLNITSPIAIAAIVAVVIGVFIFAVRRAPMWRMFALTATGSLIIVPHVYGYDATLLLLPIWLTIFLSVRPASRIAATLLATPLPFGFALADKPWAVVSSASVLIFFALLASEPPQSIHSGLDHSIR